MEVGVCVWLLGSFLYLKGLEDLVVGRRERKWFKHGELGLGKYAKGEMAAHASLESMNTLYRVKLEDPTSASLIGSAHGPSMVQRRRWRRGGTRLASTGT